VNGCLKELLKEPFGKRISLLADAGYVGKGNQKFCASKSVILVTAPRRTHPKGGYPRNLNAFTGTAAERTCCAKTPALFALIAKNTVRTILQK